MENVIKGTKESVESAIAEGKTTIIDFYAEWCGPCRVLGPVLDSIAKENPEVNIVKVNVDENSEITSEFKIRSIPAVFIYKAGVEVDKFVGAKTKEEIQKML